LPIKGLPERSTNMPMICWMVMMLKETIHWALNICAVQPIKDYFQHNFVLQICFEKDVLLRKDAARSAHYFKLAADQGSIESQVEYAEYILRGNGVSHGLQPRDSEQFFSSLFVKVIQGRKCALEFRYCVIVKRLGSICDCSL
jgi:hypothetical protein